MVKENAIAVWMLTMSVAAWGQIEPVLNLLVDRDSVAVGEPLNLLLVSDEPLIGGQRCQWPSFTPGDSLAQGWEVLSVSALDSMASPVLDAGLRRQQNLAIVAWDTGMRAVAPIFLLDSGQVAAQTLLTEIEVGLVPLEDNAAPRPMQGFKAYQFTWWERLMFLLPWIVGALAAAWLGRWLYRKWRDREDDQVLVEAQPEPEIPAHIAALALLRQLEQDKPWTAGRGKEAQAVLSEAVRIHLQGSFGVKALERTTDELTQTLRNAPTRGMAPSESDWIIALLQRSDLVKFAKQDMDGDAHLRVVQESIAWINRTLPAQPDDQVSGSPLGTTPPETGHE